MHASRCATCVGRSCLEWTPNMAGLGSIAPLPDSTAHLASMLDYLGIILPMENRIVMQFLVQCFLLRYCIYKQAKSAWLSSICVIRLVTTSQSGCAILGELRKRTLTCITCSKLHSNALIMAYLSIVMSCYAIIRWTRWYVLHLVITKSIRSQFDAVDVNLLLFK